MTTGQSTSELTTLQAVRLAGFADIEALAPRARHPVADVREDLRRCATAGHVERMSFADASGWILTDSGSSHLAALLTAEVHATGARAVLEEAIHEFEAINGDFVDTISRWQLRSTEYGGPGPPQTEADEIGALLRCLSEFGDDLRDLMSPVVAILPRFDRYPVQYTSALDRARSEGLRWVTGVGILSCHVVWAELHQDLLSSLGRDRAPKGG